MPAPFDLKTLVVTEFGVGIDDGTEPRFVLVPVDSDVQTALREMVEATRDEMKEVSTQMTRYDPSEKYAAHEHLQMSLEDD